jgi:hypothetical protein
VSAKTAAGSMISQPPIPSWRKFRQARHGLSHNWSSDVRRRPAEGGNPPILLEWENGQEVALPTTSGYLFALEALLERLRQPG